MLASPGFCWLLRNLGIDGSGLEQWARPARLQQSDRVGRRDLVLDPSSGWLADSHPEASLAGGGEVTKELA